MSKTYEIIQKTKTGQFVGVVSGCGKNKGTWDSDHSRSSAYKWASVLRKEKPDFIFTVSEFGQ